ncbi:MAG: LysR family transcriptional regulator [Bacteroidetes bacterium]|nr:MAG: LysR family transcriptional regulator [Bacteroidota bacterium]
MEIRHLKMIKEVARQGNLTRAAEFLYLSQSALSHQLREVEEYFKAQIFIRQKKQMLLTDAGRLILESSEKILSELEQTRSRVQLITEKDAGEIRISTECYTSYHWLSSFLSEFKTQFPKVEINIVPDATYNSIQCLLDNKIDIGIVEDNLNPKLNYVRLFGDEFMAIVPPEHSWSNFKWIAPELFYDQNYVMYNIPNEVSTVYNLLFSKGRPRKVYKIALTEAIIQMVKAGIGVAVLPHWVVRPHVESGELIAIPISRKGIKRVWYAATLKNKQVPPYMNVFTRNLAKHLKQSEELAMFECN